MVVKIIYTEEYDANAVAPCAHNEAGFFALVDTFDNLTPLKWKEYDQLSESEWGYQLKTFSYETAFTPSVNGLYKIGLPLGHSDISGICSDRNHVSMSVIWTVHDS